MFWQRVIINHSHSTFAPKKDDKMADEEKKGKAEEAAEKTGEVVGKGLKKGFGFAKALGKGAKDAVTEKKEEKK
ncbi:MAG TPA: hypothetical protein VGB78_04845 [Thermoplasmata archaeon]